MRLKDKLPKAQTTARKMVGDGKLPNKYWVSITDQWLTNKANKDEKENNNYDWSGSVYNQELEAYECFGPFDTFAEAKAKADQLANEEIVSPEDEYEKKYPGQKNYYSVQIEDRLTGTCYEGAWYSTGIQRNTEARRSCG